MSKLEENVKQFLMDSGIYFESERPIPVVNYPWKTKHSRKSPKCDIYINSLDLYIEVKGFMTMEAMAKMGFFTTQENIKYYIFQGTEWEWNPWINEIKSSKHDYTSMRKSIILKENINHQLKELLYFKTFPDYLKYINNITRRRLQDFIKIKICQYNTWTKSNITIY